MLVEFANGSVETLTPEQAKTYMPVTGGAATIKYISAKAANGETGQFAKTLVVTAYSAAWPANIATANAIEAGDATLFKTLASLKIQMSNGSVIPVSKVTVNSLAVNELHIINLPGVYTVTLSLTGQNGSELSNDYTLTVRPATLKTNNIDNYRFPIYPDKSRQIYAKQCLPRNLTGLRDLANALPPAPTNEVRVILLEDHQ